MNRSLVLAGTVAVALAAGTAATWNHGAFASQPAKDTPKAQPPAQPPKGDKPAQPPKGDKPAQPSTDAMPEAPKPTEHHKVLDVTLGTWEGTVKFWTAPGTEPMEHKGIIRREWDMNGLFLIEHVTGPSDSGTPFKGMGIVGYNTVDKRYESTWIENMATHITFMTGKYDAAKKTLTFEGDVINPMTGKRERHRDVLDLSDPNKEVGLGYAPGPDGKEFKCFEGTFTKKK